MIKNKKIHLTTLGCSKNLYDSEILMGQLKANNVTLMEDPREADIVIVNTCGFIESAKQESIEAILEAGLLKKYQPGLKLLICGCLSKRYNLELRKELPEVDAFFGTEDFDKITNYLGLSIKSPKHLYEKRERGFKKRGEASCSGPQHVTPTRQRYFLQQITLPPRRIHNHHQPWMCQ